MLDVPSLAACLASCAEAVVNHYGLDAIEAALANPASLADAWAPKLDEQLAAIGISRHDVVLEISENPYIRLVGVFSVNDLPDTPTVWKPVPNVRATALARVAIVLISRVAEMETISYGSENDGELFVNLVTLAGQGAMVEKSKKAMQGHTDAATFPFRGTRDPEDRRIAPSPDVVFLAAIRNPDNVPTNVVPLANALAGLSAPQIEVLKGPRLTLSAQRSFQRGTEAILGSEHHLDGTHVLFDSPEGTWVRYTHAQSQVYDQEDGEAVEAKGKFETACAQCVQAVTLEPGDLLLVNNRKALHGRSLVGEQLGGQTRWLMRSYGLNTAGLEPDRRYPSPSHVLFP